MLNYLISLEQKIGRDREIIDLFRDLLDKEETEGNIHSSGIVY